MYAKYRFYKNLETNFKMGRIDKATGEPELHEKGCPITLEWCGYEVINDTGKVDFSTLVTFNHFEEVVKFIRKNDPKGWENNLYF